MKCLLLAGCAIFALSGTGAQAATLAAWQGSATFTKLAPAASCANAGFSAGDLAHSVYRAHLNSGEPNAGISFIGSRGATIYFDASSIPDLGGNGNYNAFLIGGRATTTSGGAPYTGTYKLKVTPATITATTKQVTVTGTITNFFNSTGCTATFEASYFLRPD